MHWIRISRLSLDEFASFGDVMEVDSKHNRRSGTRYECLFDDGSTISARTKADVRRIGELARGCDSTKGSISGQIRTMLGDA